VNLLFECLRKKLYDLKLKTCHGRHFRICEKIVIFLYDCCSREKLNMFFIYVQRLLSNHLFKLESYFDGILVKKIRIKLNESIKN